jgi:zinc transport system substrate-binding protein
MKKYLLYILILSLLAAILCGCVEIKKEEAKDTRLYVVCTAFPQYDFIQNIAGDAVRLELLVPAGNDTHNFALKDISVSKLSRLQDADFVLYVGGESDALLIADLKKTLPQKTQFVSLLSLVQNPLCGDNHADHDGHAHSEKEYDEHVWTSPKRAMELVSKLTDLLCKALPEKAEAFGRQSEAYLHKLSRLDGRYEDAMAKRSYDTLIFADRFPFRYLCSDYRIEAEAAFAGCSGEVEPSLSVLDALYGKAKELGLPAVLCMEGSNRAYADNLAKKLGCQSLLLHSCHNLSTELMETKDYLSLMEDNLEVLKIALGIGN